MPRLLELPARITSTAGYPAVETALTLEPSPLGRLSAALTFETLSGSLVPPSQSPAGTVQIVYPRLTAIVPGRGTVQVIDHGASGWEASAAVGDEAGGSWSIELPASTPDLPRGPLGWPADFGDQPPPGLCQTARHELVYVSPTTGAEQAFVVLEGVAAAAERTVEPPRHVLSVDGLGPEGRIDRRQITYQLPAGHRKTHGQIIAEVCALVGISTSIGPELGYALESPVDIVDESAWELLREVLLSAGYWPVWDGLVLGAVEVAPDEDPVARIEWEDLALLGGFSEAVTGDAPTLVRVLGTHTQKPPGASGSVTNTTTLQVFGPKTISTATYVQSPSGPPYVTALPALNFPEAILEVSRVVREETTVGGCQNLVRTTTWAWGNPIAARYQTNTAGAINARKAGYLFETSVADGDQVQMFLWQRERFRVESITEELIARDGEGVETYRENREAGWQNPARHLKEGTDDAGETDWSTTAHDADEPVLASRAGVRYDHERFYVGPHRPSQEAGAYSPSTLRQTDWLRWERVDVTSDDANLLVSRRTSREGYGLRSGGRYWYAEDRTSQDPHERGLVVETTVESFQDARDGEHVHVSETRDIDGRLLPQGITVETVVGGRPAADVCTDETVALEGSQEIEGERCRPVPACQQEVPDERALRFVEAVPEAGRIAGKLLTWLSAPVITFAVPAAATLTPLLGRAVTLNFGPVGRRGKAFLELVRHYGEATPDGRAHHYTECQVRWIG